MDLLSSEFCKQTNGQRMTTSLAVQHITKRRIAKGLK